ncbi:choline kinase alpha-like [Oppia nitens]|uniref:choline kinase alpha-like n=1 Tax=Oppia nitens TaxID=1686743 RepID=UPI0023D97E7D|nr:choline kinase alpha-like [Oppia nitens]
MVSENQLGPKVYAIFEHGQILKYYKHKQFLIEEQNDPKLVDELFRKLARIHAMDVPIKRTYNWALKDLDDSYSAVFDSNIDINEMFRKYKCESLLSANMKSEIQLIKQLIAKADSPVVFIHNDFHACNILVTDRVDNINGQIVVIDFEYSSYGFRGLDFIALMLEWSRKPFDFSVDGIPHNDSLVRPLIEIYLNECQIIYGKQYSADKRNSVDHIINEIKLFHLIWCLIDTIVMLKLDLTNKSFFNNIPFSYPEMSFKNYLTLKKRYEEMKII